MIGVNVHLNSRDHAFKIVNLTPASERQKTLMLEFTAPEGGANANLFLRPEQAHEIGLALIAAWGKYHVEPTEAVPLGLAEEA